MHCYIEEKWMNEHFKMLQCAQDDTISCWGLYSYHSACVVWKFSADSVKHIMLHSRYSDCVLINSLSLAIISTRNLNLISVLKWKKYLPKECICLILNLWSNKNTCSKGRSLLEVQKWGRGLDSRTVTFDDDDDYEDTGWVQRFTQIWKACQYRAVSLETEIKQKVQI